MASGSSTKAKAPCMEDGCDLPRYSTRHRCTYHYLLTEPIEIQIQWADRRLRDSRQKAEFGFQARVAESRWPEGKRWCSGCQSFIPLFYARGSQCRACSSRAKHGSHVERTYDLSREEYEQLLTWQRGRCFVCGRVPRSRRLAVDHDHATGLVRGLLCADDERGCNHAVLGNLEASARTTALDAARRLVAYLELPPIDRMRRGDTPPGISREETLTRQERVRRSVTGHGEWPAEPGQERLAAVGAQQEAPAPF